MRDSLQFCRLCDSVLGRMLARHLSFISALWTESELREREGEGGREKQRDEGGLAADNSSRPLGRSRGYRV